MRTPWVALAALLALPACAPSASTLRQQALHQAAQAGFTAAEVPAAPYTIQAFERIRQPGAPVRVFIEGDGKAWLTAVQPSPNPTPDPATGLQLALADPSPNVAYLARPCQYLWGDACAIPVWTYDMWTETNISAMNTALNRWQGHPIELVGYSGGGGVALLLAARRTDVVNLRTVAGNLDTAHLARIHGTSTPPPGTLNPADARSRTAHLPQLHFSGTEDKVVLPILAQTYVNSLPAPHCAEAMAIPGTSHMHGWQARWKTLSDKKFICETK